MGVNLDKVGSMINQLMRNKGYTDATLSSKLGLTPQAVYKWRHGKSLPDIDNLLLISEIFDVSLEYLIDGRDPSNER